MWWQLLLLKNSIYWIAHLHYVWRKYSNLNKKSMLSFYRRWLFYIPRAQEEVWQTVQCICMFLRLCVNPGVAHKLLVRFRSNFHKTSILGHNLLQIRKNILWKISNQVLTLFQNLNCLFLKNQPVRPTWRENLQISVNGAKYRTKMDILT